MSPMFSISGLGSTLFLAAGRRRWLVAVGSVVDLVLWEVVCIDVRVYLACAERCKAKTRSANELCLEVVLPMCLLNLFVAGLWRFLGEGWLRWVICSGILILAYVVIGKRGDAEKPLRTEELSVCGVREKLPSQVSMARPGAPMAISGAMIRAGVR